MDKGKRQAIGYEYEDKMRSFFKGQKTCYDEVDFETSTTLYEVKSCKMFLRRRCKNNGKETLSSKFGRFKIKTDNHIRLYLRALQHKKQAKYIFVVRVNTGQYFWKVVPWKHVNLDNSTDLHEINWKEIWGYF